MAKRQPYQEVMKRAGYTHRDFLRFCSYDAAITGIEASGISRVIHAFEKKARPPVV